MSAADKDIKELERGSSHEERMRNQLTPTLTLSPEDYERLFLAPKGRISGDLRTTLANPTPIALLGFSVGLMPLTAAFMGWRGAGGNAVASTACSVWFGGVLLFIAGFGEFLLGNTFPMIVFFGYGAHFLTQATTFIPWFNAIGYFAESTQGTAAQGLQNPQFLASFAFYPVAMALLSFCYLIGSLRTNVCFLLIFVQATIGFSMAAGAFFSLSTGGVALGNKLIVGTGACFFGAMTIGWYLLLAVIVATMELPIPDLPVGDLSTIIKARPRGQAKPKEE